MHFSRNLKIELFAPGKWKAVTICKVLCLKQETRATGGIKGWHEDKVKFDRRGVPQQAML